jgi:hypothetical protein
LFWAKKSAWTLAIWLVYSLPSAPAIAAADSEDELKAATVWLFVQYSQLAPNPDGTINVGVLGRPSFAQTLRHTLEGKVANGHPVKAVELKADIHGCQVVYFATDKVDDLKRGLQSAQPLHALTIGESDRFLEYGGAVTLFIVDGHIAFETSIEALGRTGVAISSNLLKFGQIRNRTKGPGAK